MSAKYPRSMHVPFSPGSTSDDKIASYSEFDLFLGRRIIITEKLDGSNVCLTNSNVYSRSHSGPPGHKSFDPLIKFHSENKAKIPENISLFGEWAYAVHSINYLMLQHHLNLFGVRNDITGKWAAWDEVTMWADEIGVAHVPMILDGCFAKREILKNVIRGLSQLSSVYGPEREGLVIRTFEGPNVNDKNQLEGLQKWVRANHIKTLDKHWQKQEIVVQPCITKGY